ncbi:MAG: MarR family winged helix-turn-helix transcriptional regulator [Anaerolineae bacterium]
MSDADAALHEDAIAVERAVMHLTWLEHKLFAVQLDEFQLTAAQYLSLLHVARCAPGCTMGQLAEKMHQSSATMTGIVDRLCRRGLAERRPDPDDRRRVTVVLTDSGRRLLAATSEAKRRRTLDILRTFTESERRALVRLLEAYLARAADRI